MIPNAMPPIGIPTSRGMPTSMQCNMGPPMSSLPPVPPPHGTALTQLTSRAQQNGNPGLTNVLSLTFLQLDLARLLKSISILFVQKDDLDLELSNAHHPSCKLNQSHQGSFEDDDIEPEDLDEEMYNER